MGSNPFVVWWYLHRRGFRFRLAVSKRGMERLVKQAVKEHPGRVAGVLAYIHKKGAHYTTFIDEESYQRVLGTAAPDMTQVKRGTSIRFLNAVYGIENHCVTVGEFFKKHVSFPLCFVIVAK